MYFQACFLDLMTISTYLKIEWRHTESLPCGSLTPQTSQVPIRQWSWWCSATRARDVTNTDVTVQQCRRSTGFHVNMCLQFPLFITSNCSPGLHANCVTFYAQKIKRFTQCDATAGAYCSQQSWRHTICCERYSQAFAHVSLASKICLLFKVAIKAAAHIFLTLPDNSVQLKCASIGSKLNHCSCEVEAQECFYVTLTSFPEGESSRETTLKIISYSLVLFMSGSLNYILTLTRLKVRFESSCLRGTWNSWLMDEQSFIEASRMKYSYILNDHVHPTSYFTQI